MTEAIPHWVNNYVGIPYLDRGCSPSGCDCWGLYRLVMREQFDLELPEIGYSSADDSESCKYWVACERGTRWRETTGAAKAGDLILLRIGGQPVHVGMVVTPHWMLHSLRGHDSALERHTGHKWAHRVEGTFRWP